MKTTKKVFTVLLAAIFFLTAMPLSVFTASATDGYTEASTLILGQEVTVSLDESTPHLYYKFIPEVTGKYILESFAPEGEDTIARLYSYTDENHTDIVELYCSDDDGDYANFRLSYELVAGNTYFYKVTYYEYEQGSYEEGGSFPFMLTAASTVSSIEVLQLPNKTEYYKNTLGDSILLDGLVLSVRWSDGSLSDYSYDEYGDYFEDETLYWEAEELGNTGRVTLIFAEKEAYFDVTLTESDILSIDVKDTGDFPFTLIEAEDGYGDYYLDEFGEEQYYYAYNIPNDNLTLTVTYKDGTVKEFKDVTGRMDDYFLITDTGNQAESPWETGSENNEVVFTYAGVSVTKNYRVVKTVVTDIEVVSVSTLIEEVDGYYTNSSFENVGQYFHYFFDKNDVVVKVSYIDGKEPEVVGLEELANSRCHNEQEIDPWTLGGDNLIYIYYRGFETTHSVELTANLVSSFEVASCRELKEGEGGHLYSSFGDDGLYTAYYYNLSPKDFAIKVKYTDNTEKVITDLENEKYFRIDDSEQYEQPWVPGGENNLITLTYYGKEISYNVNITPTDIEKIELVKDGPGQIYENTDGWWYDDDNGNEVFYYTPNYEEFEFKITEKDGTSYTIQPFSDQYYSDDWFVDDSQYHCLWSMGGAQNEMMFYYKGAICRYNVNIVPTPVKSITITKQPTITEIIYGDARYYSCAFWGIGPCVFEDISGMELLVTMEDGSSKVLTVTKDDVENFTLDGFGLRTNLNELDLGVGEHEVEVYYRGARDTFCLTVAEDNVKNIEVTNTSGVVEFVNDAYTPKYEGLHVKVTYDDDTTEEVTVTSENVEFFVYGNRGYGNVYVKMGDSYLQISSGRHPSNNSCVTTAAFYGESANVVMYRYDFGRLYDDIVVKGISAKGALKIIADGSEMEVVPDRYFDDRGSAYGCVSELEDGYLFYNVYKTESANRYSVNLFGFVGDVDTAGNVSDDDKIDLNDVVTLAQHMAGWEVETADGSEDVNGDGKIDLQDVVHLAQYVAGWEVYLSADSAIEKDMAQ